MPGAKEIRTKIKSVKNTQKITRAMEMVAASKMRRAQERMRATRPYADKMQQVIGHLALAHPEYRHPFLVERTAKRVGLIVVSTDRGLCGGLNINLFKAAITALRDWRHQGLEIDLCTIGTKGLQVFTRIGGNVTTQTGQLGDTPRIADLIGTIKVMLDAYYEGRIDRLYLLYNRFVNTMTQKSTLDQLLPLPPATDESL